MAKRPNVFSTPTRLWHPSAGWFEWPIGETDPGDAWSEFEGGHRETSGTEAGVTADLTLANDRNEKLTRTNASLMHDVAQISKRANDALADVVVLKQAVVDAERERDEAMRIAAQVTRERDNARTELAQARSNAVPEGVHDKRTVESPGERARVVVPSNWESLPFLSKKALAAKLTSDPVNNKEQVHGAILAHLAKLIPA